MAAMKGQEEAVKYYLSIEAEVERKDGYGKVLQELILLF